MTVKEQFERLKALELNALTEKEHREIHHQFEQLALENPDAFEEAFISSARSTLSRARQLKVKEQLTEISEIVSMSYIAKHYFRKSRSWLSQRINEMTVNGKPVQFTPDELDVFNKALKEIALKTASIQLSGQSGAGGL